MKLTYILQKMRYLLFQLFHGQREYSLPTDCDLRDIQEVVRRGERPFIPFHGPGGKTCTITFYSNGGTGMMEKVEVDYGSTYTLPANTMTPPEGYTFSAWDIGGEEYQPGDKVDVYTDLTISAVWKPETVNHAVNIFPAPGWKGWFLVHYTPVGGEEQIATVDATTQWGFVIEDGKPMSSLYSSIYITDSGFPPQRVEPFDLDAPVTESITYYYPPTESTKAQFTIDASGYISASHSDKDIYIWYLDEQQTDKYVTCNPDFSFEVEKNTPLSSKYSQIRIAVADKDTLPPGIPTSSWKDVNLTKTLSADTTIVIVDDFSKEYAGISGEIDAGQNPGSNFESWLVGNNFDTGSGNSDSDFSIGGGD